MVRKIRARGPGERYIVTGHDASGALLASEETNSLERALKIASRMLDTDSGEYHAGIYRVKIVTMSSELVQELKREES